MGKSERIYHAEFPHELWECVCPCCGEVSAQWLGPLSNYERLVHLPVAVCFDCDPDRKIRYRQVNPGLVNKEYLRKGLYKRKGK